MLDLLPPLVPPSSSATFLFRLATISFRSWFSMYLALNFCSAQILLSISFFTSPINCSLSPSSRASPLYLEQVFPIL